MTRRDKFLLWCLVWTLFDTWALYSWGWVIGGVWDVILYIVTIACFIIQASFLVNEALKWEGKK